jgi:hypothetical protein
MSLARWNDDAALVPPLQLAERDAGQRYDFAGCEVLLHCLYGNVSNI